jgi:hypothetical protein
MLLRQYFRKEGGRRKDYWAFVESYRTERGPRQRVVNCLGLVDEAGGLGVENAARVNARCDMSHLNVPDNPNNNHRKVRSQKRRLPSVSRCQSLRGFLCKQSKTSETPASNGDRAADRRRKMNTNMHSRRRAEVLRRQVTRS